MKKSVTTTIITTLATLTFTAPLFAASKDLDSAMSFEQRSSVEAVCESETGNFAAVVTSHNGYSYMKVYDGYRLVESGYADKDYSYSGGTLIVSYSTGPVTRGGVSLRIRAFDHDAHNLEGYGHLTLKSNRRFVNKLMNCFIY